jgi:predicted  nucleic acid-binding Zn-ribbon protein
MMAADELAAELKRAEAQMKADEAAVAAERAAIERERDAQAAVARECAARRTSLVAEMPAALVATFEKVARVRGGIGLARAEKERCVMCQVRLRPMVFNAVKRNDAIIQCDSCQRILYYTPPAAGDGTTASAPAPVHT